MKAHATDPELIVDSVIVSFSFPKDKSKKEGSLCLVGRKEPGKKSDSRRPHCRSLRT